MTDEGHNATSDTTTSGDHSPAASASHSGTGDINIDQSVHHAPSASLTYRGERLLGKSIEDLLGYFESHTSLQANRLVEPFIGKPLRVEGSVVNISGFDHGISAHLQNNAAAMIMASFELAWEDRLAEPNLGDQLALMGRITEISSSSLFLKECELIDGSPP